MECIFALVRMNHNNDCYTEDDESEVRDVGQGREAKRVLKGGLEQIMREVMFHNNDNEMKKSLTQA